MFCLLRNGWEAIMIYGVDGDKFLIYESGQWSWVPMDEFEPISIQRGIT